MLIHKAALIAGALVVSGVATMAQAHDQARSGARSIENDNYSNQRALQDQAANRAYQAQFLITQRDVLNIARAQGVTDVEGVQHQRGGWMVDGTDTRGDNLVVHLNSRGTVLDVQRG